LAGAVGVTKGTRRKVADWRGLLIAQRDDFMQHWCMPGHLYPFEVALTAGGDVVVGSGRLAAALEQAGLPADRFDTGGPDAGKPCLRGADDRLTEIRDEHAANLEQREFDELVEGLGTGSADGPRLSAPGVLISSRRGVCKATCAVRLATNPPLRLCDSPCMRQLCR
jgi:hypothetical protein